MLEKISNNPLIVSIITLVITTFIGIIGYLLKRIIEFNKGEKDYSKNINQNNIVQNFNTGVNYSDVERIAEEVVERKLSKMKKQ